MANQKIHEYPLERFVYGDDDYYDIDYWDGLIFQTAKIRGSVIKNAILTGIAINLTAPSAFIVGGSPTDGTGTLTLTAAGLANQYIRGDGTLATLPTSGGGGNNVNYYLNGGTSASVATYYQMSKTAVIGTGVDFSLAGNGLISQWLTDVGDPNVTEIPSGNWNFEMFFSASSSGGVPKFYVELLKYSGGIFTTIANSSLAPEPITSGTAIDLYLTSLAVPFTSLAIGDRLAIRVYIVDSVLGRTIKHHTQNSHLCQIITTFSSGLSSINGLTKQTQYLAVGTSGTDFAINSVTDTHTFNLPTASATNRGALSSANWSAFNGKQNPITLTTTGSGAATFISDVLNIPTPAGGSGIFGIPNSSGVYTYYATPALAYAAATVGQTIELFADYSTSGSEELALTKNVNWNGNGHSWSKTTADASNIITTSYGSCDFSFKNINLNRSNGITSANCFLTTNPAGGKIYLDGSIFTNTSTSMYALTMSTGTLELLNGTFISSSTSCLVIAGNILNNCKFYGTTGADIRGTAIFCYAQGTTGNGFSSSGILNNCIGISTSGAGISGSGSFFNCIGRSTTLYGINPVGSNDVVNCMGISVSNIGVYLQSITSRNVVNNVGISSSSYGIQSVGTSYNYNCTAISTSSVAFLNSGATTKIYNANFISNWNNAGGYGVVGFGGNLPIVLLNCRFTLSNASAPYIFNSGTAYVIKMSKNTYEGGTSFNVNITQGITNIEDTQGNIFI